MTMQANTTPLAFTIFDKALLLFLAAGHLAALHHKTWKSERERKANMRFIMKLDPIILRDLGFTREEIAARHDGPLPISRWRKPKPLD
jgi:hypothetical protein